MILATTDTVPGRVVLSCLGLVCGSTVRARHVGEEVAATMQGMVGGEIVHYTKLLGEAREQALDRMIDQARALNADAIVSVRFSTCEVASGAAEIFAYGTAVQLAQA